MVAKFSVCLGSDIPSLSTEARSQEWLRCQDRSKAKRAGQSIPLPAQAAARSGYATEEMPSERGQSTLQSG